MRKRNSIDKQYPGTANPHDRFHAYDYNADDDDMSIINDEAVRKSAEENIKNDPEIGISDKRSIKVSSNSGIVTLSGAVNDRHSKWRAFSDAYWSRGVTDVVNILSVKNIQKRAK